MVKLKEGGHLEQDVDGKIILKLFLKKWDWGARTGLLLLRIGTDVGFL
jgi:hypothetical protein